LEYFWNNWGRTMPELLFIVCGSATSWLINNVIKNRGGLHNRVTRQLPLGPFPLAECEEYLKSRNIVYTRYQVVELYSVLGGIPNYLDYVEAGLTPAQNVDRLFFAENAPLKGEYEELYASLFKKPAGHKEVIEAIGIGRRSGMTRKELEEASGRGPGGGLTRILEELEQCGFIRKYRDFTKKKTGYHYQLMDFFSLFHIRFIRDNVSNDEHYFQNLRYQGGGNAWAGLAFEHICLAHVAQIKQALGISGVSSDVTS
jgi:hypothetical protein